MKSRHAVIIACWLASCAKTTEVPDRAEPPRSPSVAPLDAATIVELVDAMIKDDAACEKQNATVMSAVGLAHVAMDSAPHQRKARELWPAVPEPCRDGQWYLAAAKLLDLSNDPLVAGTVRLESSEAALTAALAQPDDAGVLARVALMSALGKKPMLPVDACTRAVSAGAADLVAYVCARQAILAGDGKSALDKLGTIATPAKLLDFELARAQAAKLAGDNKLAKQQAKLAANLDDTRTRGAHVNFATRGAIEAAAKKLLTGK